MGLHCGPTLSAGRTACLSCVSALLLLAVSFTPPVASAARSEQRQQRTLTLVAVGDIMLDRGVGQKIERYGPGYPFEQTSELLARADIAFGNLEGPLADRCERAGKSISFKAKPVYARGLVSAGFDVLSLANNHSADCGPTGLLQTIENLRAGGIAASGAGKTRAEAERAAILNVQGTRVAVLAFSAFSSESPAPGEGSASIAPASVETVRRAVLAARQTADLVLASFHWGQEYARGPRDEQVRLAQTAVEAGADLVIGHHPHVLQGLQLVRGSEGKRRSLIAYSLGNFVFDAPRAWDKRLVESVVLVCRLSAEGLESVEVLPVILEGFRPRPANEEESQAILSRLTRLSAEFNTKLAGRSVPLSLSAER
jgi:poly-gamma-glutamate capsule biosynthesis protein CapA/YwtB (metallophosphatase superfamily)